VPSLFSGRQITTLEVNPSRAWRKKTNKQKTIFLPFFKADRICNGRGRAGVTLITLFRSKKLISPSA